MLLKKFIRVGVLISIIFSQTTQAQERHFLVVSDAHLARGIPHVMNFKPSRVSVWNDLDKSSLQLLMASIADNIKKGMIPKPNFILYLGDMVGHVRLVNHSVWDTETDFFRTFAELFPGTSLLYTFGNNDSFQKNYGAFSIIDTDGVHKTPLSAAFATGQWRNDFISIGKACQQSLTELPCMISQNTRQGYYSAYLEPGLRLISLNSVIFANNVHSEGANNELEWLKTQLQLGKINKESILLIMHIPPGKGVDDNKFYWKPEINQIFLKLVEAYQDVIIGMLAGHTHMDEIKIIQNSSQQPLAGIYLTPSLSTSHGNAPAIRSYSYEKQGSKWQLIDYTTYFFEKTTEASVHLKKLYTYREEYCTQSEKNMTQCLNRVTASKMQQFYFAGNNAFPQKIAAPENMRAICYDE
ncbi:MAG: metallophosphoesterase [Legionellaceae bacterium]|nr:metallophosphoesterase [Legionellaceae bacterium]